MSDLRIFGAIRALEAIIADLERADRDLKHRPLALRAADQLRAVAEVLDTCGGE